MQSYKISSNQNQNAINGQANQIDTSIEFINNDLFDQKDEKIKLLQKENSDMQLEYQNIYQQYNFEFQKNQILTKEMNEQLQQKQIEINMRKKMLDYQINNINKNFNNYIQKQMNQKINKLSILN